MTLIVCFFSSFFFNDTATTEIYTLSLHDALPISRFLLVSIAFTCGQSLAWAQADLTLERKARAILSAHCFKRSEEHTSELQSRLHLVCRLLLEKKKKITHTCAWSTD